jgi:hypothetical protein
MKTRHLILAASLLALPAMLAPVAQASDWRGDRGGGHDVERHPGHHSDHRPPYGHGYGHRHHYRPPVHRQYYHHHDRRAVVVERDHHRSGAVPIIAGGILGGVIGREIGHGDDGAVIAGTIVGAVIGHEASR